MVRGNAQHGGRIFSTLLGLARPLIKPEVKALAIAGLSLGAENAIKKILGNGYGANEIKLCKLVRAALSPEKKRLLKTLLWDKARFAAAKRCNKVDFSEC